IPAGRGETGQARVWMKRQPKNRPAVAAERVDSPADRRLPHVPDLDEKIRADRGKMPTIRAERHGASDLGVRSSTVRDHLKGGLDEGREPVRGRRGGNSPVAACQW